MQKKKMFLLSGIMRKKCGKKAQKFPEVSPPWVQSGEMAEKPAEKRRKRRGMRRNIF